MELVAYYSTDTVEAANRCLTDVPLAVNCAGVSFSSKKFEMIRKRQDFYLLYGIGGKMPIVIDEHCQFLEKDTFIIIEPDTYSEYGLEKGFINYYWLHFTGFYAKELLAKLDISLNTLYSATFTDEIKKFFENR